MKHPAGIYSLAVPGRLGGLSAFRGVRRTPDGIAIARLARDGPRTSAPQTSAMLRMRQARHIASELVHAWSGQHFAYPAPTQAAYHQLVALVYRSIRTNQLAYPPSQQPGRSFVDILTGQCLYYPATQRLYVGNTGNYTAGFLAPRYRGGWAIPYYLLSDPAPPVFARCVSAGPGSPTYNLYDVLPGIWVAVYSFSYSTNAGSRGTTRVRYQLKFTA